MFVEIPHSLGETFDRGASGEIINFIYLAKLKKNGYCYLVYVYKNFQVDITRLDKPTEGFCGKPNPLYDISKPWGDIYRIYESGTDFTLINPVEKIKSVLLDLGIRTDQDDIEILLCTSTKKKMITKQNNSLTYNIQRKVLGDFTVVKDFYDFPENWRRFTSDEYVRHYGNFNIYKGVSPTFTNERDVTTDDPRDHIFLRIKNNKPEFMSPKCSNSIMERSRSSEPSEPFIYKRDQIDTNRKTLLILHLIFKSLKSKNLEMLVLKQMLPTPKYTIGSIVNHFNYFYSYIVKDIYMYLDLNYSWNIKYLCANLSEVRNPDYNEIRCTFYKQRDLTPILENERYFSDNYSVPNDKLFTYTLNNDLFENDTSIWDHNNKATICRRHHFKCRWKCSVYNCKNKVNYNGIKCKFHSGEGNKWKMRCHHKKCHGPKKISFKELSNICPVIKITKMETDIVSYYDTPYVSISSTLNKDFSVSEKMHVNSVIRYKTDNTKFNWQYTKVFV